MVSGTSSQWLWDLELTSHLFGPVHMRTLLTQMHIHWPESKLTKSDINWKKVMKSIMISHVYSLEFKKKYESLCLELLQFILLILSTLLHLHSASCHILVHVESARLNTPLMCHYVQALPLVVLEGIRSVYPN